MENHFILAYDICDDKRRRRLLKIVEAYAYRIQYSVFEMKVDERILKKIREWIEYVIDPEEDSVLIYRLNEMNWETREVFGVKSPEAEQYEAKYSIL